MAANINLAFVLSLLAMVFAGPSQEGASAPLLQKGRRGSASELAALSSSSQCRTVTEDACHTADQVCHEHVTLAMRDGISGYPGPYTFEAIQNHFHESKEWWCPQPCPACSIGVMTAAYHDLFSMSIGGCVPDGAGGGIMATAGLDPRGYFCTKNLYVRFAHFDNPHCSDIFTPAKRWLVFTDGDKTACYNMTGQPVEGGCRGRTSKLRN